MAYLKKNSLLLLSRLRVKCEESPNALEVLSFRSRDGDGKVLWAAKHCLRIDTAKGPTQSLVLVGKYSVHHKCWCKLFILLSLGGEDLAPGAYILPPLPHAFSSRNPSTDLMSMHPPFMNYLFVVVHDMRISFREEPKTGSVSNLHSMENEQKLRAFWW